MAATLTKVQELLRAGQVQEADDLVTGELSKVPSSKAAPTAAASEPGLARDADAVLHDLIGGIVAHLGTPPRLEALWQEFEAAVKKL